MRHNYDKTRRILESARREPPPPLRLCSDGHMFSEKEGNPNTPMKHTYLNSRIRPYYLRRCKRVRPTNIESLPNELLSDILVRLPADLLYDRARLVCRRWYRIIYSYDFVNTQIQHSTSGLILCCHYKFGGHHPILITATQGGRIETSEFSYVFRGMLNSSCNGLSVEQYCSSSLPYIINLATKQPFVIPSFPTYSNQGYLSVMAFSALSMKYKLILVYYKPSVGISLAVLTYGVDNSWRNVGIENLLEYATCLLLYSPLSIEGYVHWFIKSARIVMTMDMETETLTLSRFPLSIAKNKTYYLSTGSFLSLLVCHRDFLWEIWGMKAESGEWRKVLPNIELGAQKSRLQQLASAGETEVLEPVGWVKYPEVLAFCFVGKSRTCIFYNLDTQEINSTELPYSCAWYTGFVHKNSLTWLS